MVIKPYFCPSAALRPEHTGWKRHRPQRDCGHGGECDFLCLVLRIFPRTQSHSPCLPVLQKSPQSYVITPKGGNKPVLPKTAEDYGMDQNSDDSTDDESAPRKPIPSWAESKYRRYEAAWRGRALSSLNCSLLMMWSRLSPSRSQP